MSNLPGALGLLHVGNKEAFWGIEEPKADTSRAEEMDPDRFEKVKDNVPVASLDKNPSEYLAYWDLVVMASRTSPEAFARSAQDNEHVTISHLVRQPQKYRGKVVHFKGRLARVRRFDTPEHAQEAGIKYVYDCWIQPETVGANPVEVVITELPAGVEVGEELNRQVAFDAYFFKKVRYQSGKGDWRFTPLLIGRTLTVLDEGAGKNSASSAVIELSVGLVVGLLGLVVATGALVIGLGWWFRRGDARVRARLAQAKATTFFDEPLPPGAEAEAFQANPPGAPGPHSNGITRNDPASPADRGLRPDGR